MPSYGSADIRNILFAGHGGSGKTTLADSILFTLGAVSRKGSVTDGTSFSDFEKEEKEHKHSIYASLLNVDHAGKRINIIDTPGSPDLMGQAIMCLPATDIVVLVVNAQAGIEVVTRRLMEVARDRHLPRAIVINKIDMPEVDLAVLVDNIQSTFGADCLPINLPTGGGKAIVDCMMNKAGDSDLGPVADAHNALVERAVEMDEALMERYLGGEEIPLEQLHQPFIKALDEGHIIPICFTDAKQGVGIKEFLDIAVAHFPSPLEAWKRPFVAGDKEFAYSVDPSKPFMAHVFKVTTDPFIGKLALFRVYQGKAQGATMAYISGSKKAAKLSHVFHLQGKDHKEADAIIPGDIGAVAKIEDIKFNDVLHEDYGLAEVKYKSPPFPTPMYGLAVMPKARGDEQKISGALAKIVEEDPTFKSHVDRQTHELVINGMGDLHLRLVLERLKNRGLEVDTKPPKIAYKETITQKADGHHRHKKQTGGAGQFGEVFLRVEPLAEDSPLRKANGGPGLEIVNEVFGGAIPGQFIPAVEKGIHDIMDTGAIAGYPMQDVLVAITDGKHHPVDSKEVAFRKAGKEALKDAIMKAKAVLLEPIVNMEITVPEGNVGAITGDLSGKRGRIQGTDMIPGGMSVIKAQAPLSEVMQYQSQLKSVTGGQGSFIMELSHYDIVPANVQAQIVAAYKPKAEED